MGILIECPNCGERFELDASHPAVRQIRDEEFKKSVAVAVAEQRAACDAEIRGLREKLADRDDQIAYLRDMRSRLSTKMIGESLERFCEGEFNKIRTTAYPGAYFAKDNDARSGSKGDYIFRGHYGGTEILSIMFEMKNEDENTDQRLRHKNEDFLEKLDKDRRTKGCEYAVLVTTLEPDSAFYNAGIADLSYAYPKMYAVRPQCFLTIISLLWQMALSGAADKIRIRELENARSDLDTLEDRIFDFKNGFFKSADMADRHMESAVSDLDKVIDRLSKIRDEIDASRKSLKTAAGKANKLTVRKLCAGTGYADAKGGAVRETEA